MVFNSPLCQGWSLGPLETCKGVQEVARKVLIYGDGGRQDQAAAAGGTAVLFAPLLPQGSIQIAFHICGCTSALLWHGPAILTACGRHGGYEHWPERRARSYLS